MNYCEKCGAEVSENSNFCNVCGTSLNKSSQLSSINTQQAHQNNHVYAVLGWVFCGIAILFIPIIFGAGAVVFGYLYRKIDETHGTIIMIAGVACAIIGMLLGMALVPTYHY